jgi:hypothetical protein
MNCIKHGSMDFKLLVYASSFSTLQQKRLKRHLAYIRAFSLCFVVFDYAFQFALGRFLVPVTEKALAMAFSGSASTMGFPLPVMRALMSC